MVCSQLSSSFLSPKCIEGNRNLNYGGSAVLMQTLGEVKPVGCTQTWAAIVSAPDRRPLPGLFHAYAALSAARQD